MPEEVKATIDAGRERSRRNPARRKKVKTQGEYQNLQDSEPEDWKRVCPYCPRCQSRIHFRPMLSGYVGSCEGANDEGYDERGDHEYESGRNVLPYHGHDGSVVEVRVPKVKLHSLFDIYGESDVER